MEEVLWEVDYQETMVTTLVVSEVADGNWRLKLIQTKAIVQNFFKLSTVVLAY